MLFNSYEFLFFFLPLSVIGYFLLNRLESKVPSKIWLAGGSLFFYGWWKPEYLFILIFSLLFNFGVASFFRNLSATSGKKVMLLLGISVNLALLGYFKYYDFVIDNINFFTGAEFQLKNLLLPLAISFFTFQQIAFLVDSYNGFTKEYNFLNYTLFVTFFPQLIAGPIVHHSEMMPQFAHKSNFKLNYGNLAKGSFIFFNGLFKKVIIADTFAVWATNGFDVSTELGIYEAWLTSLSYTFQLYFDFSGYSDMAIGLGWIFNIKIPFNFNSPYKAITIQDFWRKWHITLSRFLRDYLYIPLGGNQNNFSKTLGNLLITFLLGGLWHGAGWTFIFWGFLHGTAMIVQRLWQRAGIIRLPDWLAWFITFNFVNLAWVYFRALSWKDAQKVIYGMFNLKSVVELPKLSNLGADKSIIFWIIGVFVVILVVPNTNRFSEKFDLNWKYLILFLVMAIYTLLNLDKISEFIYFGF